MGVTDALVRVHRVDRQLRDLRSRLRAAEKFLNEQQKGLGQIETQRSALESQLRQAEAASAERESEAERIQARIDHLREQMNSAKTNKEYKALLTEVNTFKADKGRVDEEGIELLTKVDELKATLAEMDSKRSDRTKVRDVAQQERDGRASEIQERVNELERERSRLVGDVPADVLSLYDGLVAQLDDEAMAPVEEQDRKRHEYSCSACMMSIPVESISTLLGGADKICRCVSCGCILYIEPELAEEVHAAGAKR
jgi:predicted  nucleic acid-binding Zn-ribbon protein